MLLSFILANSKNLQRLSLAFCRQLTESCVYSIAKSSKNLFHFNCPCPVRNLFIFFKNLIFFLKIFQKKKNKKNSPSTDAIIFLKTHLPFLRELVLCNLPEQDYDELKRAVQDISIMRHNNHFVRNGMR